MLAIFGALVPLPNRAAAAMRAALKMQERLGAEAGQDGAFKIRIGLNTGSCVVGNVGSINRINCTAIGDSVNVAARLCLPRPRTDPREGPGGSRGRA